MNEKIIQEKLRGHFDHVYKLTNSYIFSWECDYFGITKSTGYVYEIEIKTSKSDFNADFKKTEKHHCLKNGDKELLVFKSKEKTESRPTDKKEIVQRLERRIWENVSLGYCPLKIKNNFIPNRFYYAVPESLVDSIIDDIPEYAGLLSVKNSITQIKAAPFLHKRKMIKLLAPILLDKFYYKYNNLRFENWEIKKDLKRRDYYYEFNFDDNITQMEIDF